MAPSIPSVDQVEAAQHAKYLAIGSFTVLAFEHLVTLDKEIAFFWSGKWSISRVLFFLNRYVTPVYVIISLHGLLRDNGYGSLKNVIIGLAVVVLLIVEVIHALRLWYLYQFCKYMRIILVVLSCAYGCSLAALVALVETNSYPGRIRANKSYLWIPTLGSHTLLYLFTVARAFVHRSRLREEQSILKRLILDGGLFYFIVLVSVGFSAIGEASGNLLISESSLLSNFMFVMLSVCMSRVMFSVRSLAANLSTDADWLLGNLELSHVQWQRGDREGELVVAVEDHGPDEYELSNANMDQLCVDYVSRHSAPDAGRDRFQTVDSVASVCSDLTLKE